MLVAPDAARVPLLTLLLSLLLIRPFVSIAEVRDVNDIPCLQCHEEVYAEASSNPYLHTIVTEDCEVCHITDDPGYAPGEDAATIISEIDREHILALGELPEETEYELKATVRDSNEEEGEPVVVTIVPQDVKRVPHPAIRELSGVTVVEIKKGPYVRATISWDTDAFATSEIEYISDEKCPDIISIDDTFTKKHTVTLNGLKHKSTYRFTVLSRDLHGNALKSEEHSLNTAVEFSNIRTVAQEKSPLPNIDHLEVFRVKKEDYDEEDMNGNEHEAEDPDRGFYVMISTNKPSVLTVSLEKSANRRNRMTETNQCNNLAPEKYSNMDVCFDCHEQNASHPVGIKSEGMKTRIPDDLPTIDDGIITCVTCHYPHGGDRPFFARLDFNKELCVKCHIIGRYAR